MNGTADISICGAGITGIAAAHSLSKVGIKDILLFDERSPHIPRRGRRASSIEVLLTSEKRNTAPHLSHHLSA